MAKIIKMAAFDLDGTIADTIPFSIEAFRRAVSPYAGRVLSDYEILQTFGVNEVGMIKAVVNDRFEDALNDFYKIYEELHEKCPAPYEGIIRIFDLLDSKGIKTALITGKGKRAAEITLGRLGLTNRFCDVETGLEERPSKTDAILNLLEKYELQKNEFYYVGDAVSDVVSSRDAGVTCLSAAWGSCADTESLKKENANHIFLTTAELYDLFLSC